MRHNYKKMVIAAGMAAIIAYMPVTAMAGTNIQTSANIFAETNIQTSANLRAGTNLQNSTSILAGMNILSDTNIMTGVLNSINTEILKNNAKVSGTDIVVDADATDWKNIKERKSASDKVSSWKAAIASDYSALYLYYEGMTSTEWDYNYAGGSDDVLFKINYADGTQGQKNNIIKFAAWENMTVAKDGNYGDIANASAATVNEAHGNTAGPYMIEASIPMDFFASSDFTITFAGISVALSDIEVLEGVDTGEEEPDPVYNGITIDGSFKDWDAVTKYDAGCPNEEHKYCIEKTAMVFDGDYVYIYIKDGNAGSAFGAGSHSNGRYSIKTDLGNELVFQLTQDGGISGVENAECIHVGKQWEIAIPKADLPAYNNTLSFGLYLTDPFVTDVYNLDGSTGKDTNIDIAYDGLYGDWNNYPHTTIEYATAGTQQDRTDAKGALYCVGSTLYGHVVTTMPEHLAEAGGEFMNAVTILFNNNWSQVFYPRMETVAEDGSINWNTPKGGMADGTYEFYLFSTDAWHNSPSIYDANDMDKWYGKMIVTIKDGKDECEFYLNLEKVAEKLNCDASDFKRIDAQFGRLGQQWITTAGASSGAWLGLILCVGVTAAVLVRQKKKSDRQVS